MKSWKANLPAPEIDILIVDEIGKNISGAGMDTKVINRSVTGHYEPFPRCAHRSSHLCADLKRTELPQRRRHWAWPTCYTNAC